MSRFLGRRPAQAVAASLLTVTAGLGVAGVAHAAAAPAHKVPLTQTNRDCGGSVIGQPMTQPFGFAVITKTGSGKLVVEVALKGGPPDTTYNIRVIQLVPGDADCTGIDGTLTTNASGKGNANVQEHVLRGASSVWVDLNNQANFADFFDTQVVSF